MGAVQEATGGQSLLQMAAGFLGYPVGDDRGVDRHVKGVNFTQDLSGLAVATKSGYRVYSLKNEFSSENLEKGENREVLLAEKLMGSSLLAVVYTNEPQSLRLIHTKKGTEICSYSYTSMIRAVKLNKARLVLCLDDQLYIHNIKTMQIMHTIRDTPRNTAGLLSLATAPGEGDRPCFIAYPASSVTGQIHVFDANTLKSHSTITAHNNPLAALTFNVQGSLIATASQKGTVIRVFKVDDGSKLFEFRRGMKRCADIYCLSFSRDSEFLCCSSNTETVHIFKLELSSDGQGEASQGWYGYLGQALRSSSSYLPSTVSEVLKQERDFCVARLPVSGVINSCAITTSSMVSAAESKQYKLLVATLDGLLYVYGFDIKLGGECSLLSQHRIDGLDKPVDAENSAAGSAAPPLFSDSPLSLVNGKISQMGNRKLSSENSAKPLGNYEDPLGVNAAKPCETVTNNEIIKDEKPAEKVIIEKSASSGSIAENEVFYPANEKTFRIGPFGDAKDCQITEDGLKAAEEEVKNLKSMGSEDVVTNGKMPDIDTTNTGKDETSGKSGRNKKRRKAKNGNTKPENTDEVKVIAETDTKKSGSSKAADVSVCKVKENGFVGVKKEEKLSEDEDLEHVEYPPVGEREGELRWSVPRRSYATALQAVGALRDGPMDNQSEERCIAQLDLEDAAVFEDARSGDSPNGSALDINDSAEFPSFNHIKRS